VHTELMAAKAVTFPLAVTEGFRHHAIEVIANARVMAMGLQDRGFRIITGGTDSHIVLVDLGPRGLTGKQAQEVLERAGIVTNKSLVPFDSQKPAASSGLRLGIAGITCGGFREAEMVETVDLIAAFLESPEDDATLDNVREKVSRLCMRFQPPRDGRGCMQAY
jgi:glycine hydroxymethyltransferase